AFMIPAIVRYNLDAGAGTLGAIMAAIGLGSLLGSIALLRLSTRPNKGEPLLVGFIVTGAALAGIGASTNAWLSLALAFVGGVAGVLFVGLSTVVVQAMSSDEIRARALAIWAAAFVGMLPFGALLTGGLAALIGPGGAVFASRCERVDCALEAVEDVGRFVFDDLERLVVVVSADLAFGHEILLGATSWDCEHGGVSQSGSRSDAAKRMCLRSSRSHADA